MSRTPRRADIQAATLHGASGSTWLRAFATATVLFLSACDGHYDFSNTSPLGTGLPGLRVPPAPKDLWEILAPQDRQAQSVLRDRKVHLAPFHTT